MLEVLGASEAEDRIYRELMTVPSVDEAELSATLALPAELLRTALAALERRGLAYRTAKSPPRFAATAPDLVLPDLLLRQRTGLAAAQVELEQLVTLYRSSRRTHNAEDLIEVVGGAEQIAQRLAELARTATTEVVSFVKAPFVAVGVSAAEELANPTVPCRIVYEDEVLRIPGIITPLWQSISPHDQVRTHPKLPIKLIIADGQTGLLPLTRDTNGSTPAAVLVRSSGLLDAMLALFEHYWQASRPLRLTGEADSSDAAPAEPVGIDQRILSLLMSGITDEAIARELGISVRTVRRRVQVMMDVAGVATRIQLGWHAAHQR